jgi:hypothetical protein
MLAQGIPEAPDKVPDGETLTSRSNGVTLNFNTIVPSLTSTSASPSATGTYSPVSTTTTDTACSGDGEVAEFLL